MSCISNIAKSCFAIALLALLSGSSWAAPEEWVPLRSWPKSAAEGAQELVDTNHIDILESGLRRARWKGDLVTGRVPPEKRTPDTVSYVISIMLFDCDKRLMAQQGFESHLVGGRTQSFDYSNSPGFPVWGPFTNDNAEPYFSFVCKWDPAKK